MPDPAPQPPHGRRQVRSASASSSGSGLSATNTFDPAPRSPHAASSTQLPERRQRPPQVGQLVDAAHNSRAVTRSQPWGSGNTSHARLHNCPPASYQAQELRGTGRPPRFAFVIRAPPA
jgi:hypothetical protein